MASGVRRLASGVWRLAFGVWRLAFGIRILHLASCILHLASCILLLASCFRLPASGFRLPAHPDAADIGPLPPRRASPNISVCFQLFRIVVGDPRAEKPWQSTVQSGCPFAQPICKVSR
ncbi:phosphotransferase enzyme family protein [Burkholderia pseudomallei]|nr:phosphotransferase enzyme family protein [Burkholderia pseudomallei]